MTVRKRIYLAGCGGMLGEAFYKAFALDCDLKCTDIDVNEGWLSYLDFRDYNAYLADVAAFAPDYLFHLGAHTDLEYCEKHLEDAYLTNTLGVENAVYIANKLNIPLLYISSAGIFDGSKDMFDDWDTPNPLGHYARSKYAGEVFVIQNCHRYLICRAGWMMGGGPRKDKKFTQKVAAQIKAGKKTLFIVNDKLGSLTYTHDFACNVKLLLGTEYWGLYNMACGGPTSRLEVAEEMIRILALENQIKIERVDSGFWKNSYFAARPQSERLINRKLDIRKLNIMRDWRICLREYLTLNYRDYF